MKNTILPHINLDHIEAHKKIIQGLQQFHLEQSGRYEMIIQFNLDSKNTIKNYKSEIIIKD